jgi:dipeptidyl-peptidase 4
MMKTTFALIFFSLLITSGYPQKKLLTMEDALVRNRSTLAAENLRQLQFLYGTDDYVYLKKIDGQDVWVRGSFKNRTEQPFLTLQQLNQRLRTGGKDTFAAMPAIQFNKSEEWGLTLKGNKLSLNDQKNQWRTIIDKSLAEKTNAEVSAAGNVAYLDSFNLFVSTANGRKQVTTDGSENIVYASPVHQQEFGITKGIFWSNAGNLLAFYRMDQSMVPNYPIVDWSSRPAKVVNVKYPMSGDKSHHVTLGVYNVQTGRLVYLQTGEPAEQYLTNIAWSPDDKLIYIAVLNRGQDHLKLNQYDASTGAFVKTLFEEKDEKYVEPLVPMEFVKNNPNQFIWQSSRDGWNHLYLYDVYGKLIRQLTSGEWEVTEVKGFDAKGENLFYMSTEVSPLSKNLYTVNLKSGKRRAITQGNVVHTTQISSTGRYVLANVSDVARARQLNVIDVATGKSETIFTAPDPLREYALGRMEIFTLKAADGTPLYCRMFKPINFDSTKKYPLVTYWYGGPHAQMITSGYNGGAGDYWFQYMAQQGFVVFTIDTHGSDNRGKKFESSIFRNAGAAQMEDLMTGVNHLRSLPFVDQSRMGLFGWSYGGFMTINFQLTYPGIFKAAVAGGPVVDWKYYEIMYTERYMDTPQENPQGFDATDLTKRVDKLKGKLLLIHGMQDNVVVMQHSVKFVRAAIDKGVQVDYMIYPGHEHNVLGKDRAHLYQKVTDYFMLHLK